MQTLDYKVAMPREERKGEGEDFEKLKPTTLQIPPLLVDELRKVWLQLGLRPREKWKVVAAAIILLMELPREAQRVYAEQVGASLGRDGMRRVMDRALSGELREAARAAVEKGRPKGPEKVQHLSPKDIDPRAAFTADPDAPFIIEHQTSSPAALPPDRPAAKRRGKHRRGRTNGKH